MPEAIGLAAHPKLCECSLFEALQRLRPRLHLTDTDGTRVVIDFAPLIQQGGVYASLADPACFAQVQVGTGGRFIEWPGG